MKSYKLFITIFFILTIAGALSAESPKDTFHENTRIGSIYFGLNSSDISPDSLKTLAKIAKKISEHEKEFKENKKKIKVIGFADTLGETRHNLKLGAKRAEETAYTLKKLGIPLEYIIISSFGESVFPEKDAKLRKAEIWISGKTLDSVSNNNNTLFLTLLFLFLLIIIIIFLIIFVYEK
ncbi:MAG: OmpA family protein [Spirochaetia bacterium]|nr:OmpA family protein [Spirochaetia bacterium]